MAPKDRTVAVIGLGIMGSAIAANLMAAGFAVCGYDIDPDKATALAKAGGAPRGSASEAVRGCTLALTSLPSVAALDEAVASIVAAPQPGLCKPHSIRSLSSPEVRTRK